jgi:hypothetical protein
LVVEVSSLHSRGFFVGPLPTRPAARRRDVLGGLLAPLDDTPREFDNLTAVNDTMATVGVHWACATVASLGSWALVALTLAPGRDSGDWSSKLRLLVAAVLVSLFFLAATLGDGIRAAHLGNPSLWCRVPSTALGYSGTFVSQSEERGDVVHIMCGQLLQHLSITYPPGGKK